MLQNSPRISPTQSTPSPSNPGSPSYLHTMSSFAVYPSSEQTAGESSPTSLYQTLQTLQLHSAQPASSTVTSSGAIQRSSFSADDQHSPDVSAPGPSSFAMDSLPLGDAACHPNLQMIREDLASSHGTVLDSGSRSDTPSGRPLPTVSPPHPVISVTDALGRVMPVVMVTQSDAAAAEDAVPMDESASASLADFPAGYFAGYGYPGNYGPLDLSNTAASQTATSGLCSTVIRSQRSPADIYRDLSHALESSSVKELVQRCDAESGLFSLANASVSLEVRVCCGTGDDPEVVSGAEPTASALYFRHLAGDAALYDGICRELVSRLLL